MPPPLPPRRLLAVGWASHGVLLLLGGIMGMWAQSGQEALLALPPSAQMEQALALVASLLACLEWAWPVLVVVGGICALVALAFDRCLPLSSAALQALAWLHMIGLVPVSLWFHGQLDATGLLSLVLAGLELLSLAGAGIALVGSLRLIARLDVR